MVAGRLETQPQEQVSDGAVRQPDPSNNYGISRLGLTADGDSSRGKAVRPSFQDELKQRLQTPALPATTQHEDRPAPAAAAAPAPAPPAAVAEAEADEAQAQKASSTKGRPEVYKRTSAKLPRHMATRLKAYAQATGSYQYSIITEALGRFLDEAIACLPPETRDEVGELEERLEREDEERRRRWREMFTFRWK
jgi:hypothetical protein